MKRGRGRPKKKPTKVISFRVPKKRAKILKKTIDHYLKETKDK